MHSDEKCLEIVGFPSGVSISYNDVSSEKSLTLRPAGSSEQNLRALEIEAEADFLQARLRHYGSQPAMFLSVEQQEAAPACAHELSTDCAVLPTQLISVVDLRIAHPDRAPLLLLPVLVHQLTEQRGIASLDRPAGLRENFRRTGLSPPLDPEDPIGRNAPRLQIRAKLGRLAKRHDDQTVKRLPVDVRGAEPVERVYGKAEERLGTMVIKDLYELEIASLHADIGNLGHVPGTVEDDSFFSVVAGWAHVPERPVG